MRIFCTSMEVISHEGILERVAEDGSLHIRIVQSAACGGCSARSACNAAESMTKYVDAYAAEGEKIEIGDRVVVEVSKALGWKAVLLAFILPFLVLMAVLVLLVKIGVREWLAGIIAIAALVPYYIIIYLFRGKLQNEYRFTAKKMSGKMHEI